jgi:cytidine deaminase
MRCNICNKVLTDKEVNYNHDLKTYEPCTLCLDVIQDVLSKYRDRPVMDEDEFPDDDLLSELDLPDEIKLDIH